MRPCIQNVRSSNRQKHIVQVAWFLLWLAGPAWVVNSVEGNCSVGWASGLAVALSIQQLNLEREWRVSTLVPSGNQVFEEKTLLAELRTHNRPWYLPWKERRTGDRDSW